MNKELPPWVPSPRPLHRSHSCRPEQSAAACLRSSHRRGIEPYVYVAETNIIIVHGEPAHMQTNAALAKRAGVPRQLVGRNGDLFASPHAERDAPRCMSDVCSMTAGSCTFCRPRTWGKVHLAIRSASIPRQARQKGLDHRRQPLDPRISSEN